MKRISSLLCGIGIIALQACSAAPQEEGQNLASSENTATPYAYMPATLDWGSGYTAQAVAVNPLPVAAKNWAVVVDLKGGSIQMNSSGQPNWWGGVGNRTSGIVNFTPAGTPNPIPAGSSSILFTFNVLTAVGAPHAEIKAYNFELDMYKTCATSNGLNPSKAALAVAMANELGRWEPDLDLEDSHSDLGVVLKSSAVCLKNDCANTKALLGQQTYSPDQNVFSYQNFRSDLQASLQRQIDKIGDLQRNSPAKAPITDYKLTQVAGPINMGYGNCGPHYVFQVDYKSSGNPLSATDAANLMATMCFYGGAGCGSGNPYLGYITANIPGCPSGKQCIAIDPTDGDNNSGSTTTAGSAPSYPLNRVYVNTDMSLLGSACITTAGMYGTLQSKCAILPSTCKYLYCIAQ